MLLISLILIILGTKKKVLLVLGLIVFVCSLLPTIVQLLQMKHVMDHSDNPNLLSFREMTKSDNWKEEIIDYVDQKTKENEKK